MTWTHETKYQSAEKKMTTGCSVIRDDKGEYIATVATDKAPLIAAAPRMLQALIDLELLARINCPIPDGSPMHIEIKKIIEETRKK